MGEHWVGYIGNLQVHLDTLITMWAAMLFLILVGFILSRNLQIIPNKRQVLGEKIMSFFIGSLNSIKDWEKHIPLIGSLFLFILTANLMGRLPLKLLHLKQGEFASPTNDINMTAAMAMAVLVYYLYQGFKNKGIKAVFHGFSAVGIIETVIDFLDMITRPLSLSVRLFANIYAGEILVFAITAIAMSIGVKSLSVVLVMVLPVFVILFELLVAFIQAYVFMLLSTAYISTMQKEE